jgi:uncharacterized delta-60 repeat protein
MRQHTKASTRDEMKRAGHRSRPSLERLDDRCLLSGLLPGSLDPTFGLGAGFVINPTAQTAKATVLMPDNSILVGSIATSPTTGRNFLIQRYTSTGSVDPTFGLRGSVVTDFYGKNDTLEQLVVDPTHKWIYAVGEATVLSNADGTPAQASLAIARYSFQGQLDTTFGSGGKLVTPILTGYTTLADQAESAVLDPQGRLIVVGMSLPSNGLQSFSANFMARFATASGTNTGLDPTFGTGGKVLGKVIPQAPTLGKECWDAIVLTPKTVGYTLSTVGVNDRTNVVSQFNDAGTRTGVNPMDGPMGEIAFAPDNSWFASVTTGNITSTSSGNIHLETYSTTTGSEIMSVTLNLSSTLHVSRSSEVINAVTVDPKGRFVLGGSVTGYDASGQVVLDTTLLMRLTPQGAPDTSFGNYGVVTTSFHAPAAYSQVVIQPDGKILAAGQITGGTISQPTLVLARYIGDPMVIGGGGGSGGGILGIDILGLPTPKKGSRFIV